ncbi:MAG: helix-turn-helix domain-containing protein [Nitrososphaerales archaeon]
MQEYLLIQLQFSVTPESWIWNLCRGDSAAKVKILSMKKNNRHEVTHFVDIVSEKASSEELTKELQNSSDVTGSEVAGVGSNRLIGAVTSNDCRVCASIIDSKTGYFIAPAVTQDDCQMSYKLFMGGDAIPQFLQGLHSNGILYAISEISKLSSTRALTSKQGRALKSALELGYYDYPKRISTEELSKVFGIAPSTLTEILRRAEKRIITGYFDNNQ